MPHDYPIPPYIECTTTDCRLAHLLQHMNCVVYMYLYVSSVVVYVGFTPDYSRCYWWCKICPCRVTVHLALVHVH